MENRADRLFNDPRKLTYQLVKRITNDFKHEVGHGAFGRVFKGLLEDGEVVAVKVFHGHLTPEISDQQFQNEFENLKRLKHPNIVRLVGFCDETEEETVEHKGKLVVCERIHRALCLEYVPNGSLGKLLSGEYLGNNWPIRFEIIKGICNGLKYLHEGLEVPIFHFDLKPGNILLDEKMVPKIADFGLSRLIGEGNTRKTRSTLGTIGYMPPEFIKNQVISQEYDIFSLGVIIAQIIAGITGYFDNVDMAAQEFIDYVHENWKRSLQEILNYESLEVDCKQVKRCIEIAINCMEKERHKRPTIKDIVKKLDETGTVEIDSHFQMKKSMNNLRHNPREMPTDLPWKLIEDMTNGFAVERKIGSGGCGVVYKGVHPNGQEVAVKKLHQMPGLDEDQFQNELRILTGICHPNIVQLVGKSYIKRERCIEHRGRLVLSTMIDRAICLEYLPKGSLQDYLSDEYARLPWHSRYKIIKGICYGLKYLHGERIFHLDLKPSNILFDKDMVPKIVDFGLSRIFSGTQSHTTKNILCTLRYAPYAPPEFIDMGKITKKYDVFSLGIIIIKVLAGPDGYYTYSEMSSPQDFIDLVQGNWREMLQEAGWKDASYLDVYCNQVRTCTQIALKCVESNSRKRPSIEDIITMLNETEETIDEVYRQLFVVQPLNLCFPFKPDKLIPCPLHLTNNADHDIAYKIQPNTPDIFVGSLNGFVRARSTQIYILTMQKQQKPPQNLDAIHIQSTVANILSIIDSFTEAEAVHDETKEVKTLQQNLLCDWSLYDRASQLAPKVLSLNRIHTIDVHPLEPWVLITSGEARGIEIWNYKTMVEFDLSSMLALKKDVMVAKFVARNQWFVAGYKDGYMDVYCYKTMQRLRRFKAHQSKPIYELAVHPTEPYVMSASFDEGNVKLWDWEKGWECTQIFEFVNFPYVYGVTFLNIKDTDTFAVRGDAGIKICSLRSPGSVEFILSEYKDPTSISCFNYLANGDQQYLITGYPDGTVKIRDFHTKSLVQRVERVHLGSVDAICSHPVLVTGSDDGTVCVWNPTTLRPERTFNFGLGIVEDVKVCMDNSRRVLIAHSKGLAMIEMDGNDPVVANTGSSSKVENDLVISRKIKRPEPDRSEIENEENDFVVGVTDTGNVAEQIQGNGPMDEEMHCVSSKLLDVYPGKLQLPFNKANKLTSCLLQLTNTTDDHVAVRLLTKCPKRYMVKIPLCCIVPPDCMYTLIVTGSDQKKRPLLGSDEFLTLESTICLEQDIVGLQNANLDSAATEFNNFFKQAKEMAADKVYELKLSVVSDPLTETTSAQQQSEVEIVSNRKFSHVLSVDVHLTKPWIMMTNQAGEVVIWDYQAQAIAKSFDFTLKPVYSAKFIEQEEWIVAGDGYGTIYVYSYHTEEEVTNFEAHDSDITSLAVHPTYPLVLSSSEDCLIKLWDWEKNWECTRTFEGHSNKVTHVNFNPIDTNSFATASLDHTIKIWNISSPESKITLSDHPGGVHCVHSYTSDMRQYLIAGSWDGTAQIWDMGTGSLVHTLKGHAHHISCVYQHPELSVVITGSHDGTVRLWNSTTYRLKSIVGINLGVVHALGYIKDLRRIVVGCRQGIAIMGLNCG